MDDDTKRPEIEKIVEDVRSALETADAVVESGGAQVPPPSGVSTEEFAQIVDTESKLDANLAKVAGLPPGRTIAGWLRDTLKRANEATDTPGFVEVAGEPNIVDVAAPHLQAEQLLERVPQAFDASSSVQVALTSGPDRPVTPASSRVKKWLESDLKASSSGIISSATAAVLPRARSWDAKLGIFLAPILTAAVFIGSHFIKSGFHLGFGLSKLGPIAKHLRTVTASAVGTVVELVAGAAGPRVGGYIGAAIGGLVGLAPLGFAVGTALGRLAAPAVAIARAMSQSSVMGKVASSLAVVAKRWLPAVATLASSIVDTVVTRARAVIGR